MELERKWRVLQGVPAFLRAYEPQTLTQAYLPSRTGEHRIRTDGYQYWETWKGDGTIARTEIENIISAEDYAKLFSADLPIVRKNRYYIQADEFNWIIDVCLDSLAGLVLVELEPKATNTAVEHVASTIQALEQIRYDSRRFGEGIEATNDPAYKTKNLALYGIPTLKGNS